MRVKDYKNQNNNNNKKARDPYISPARGAPPLKRSSPNLAELLKRVTLSPYLNFKSFDSQMWLW